MGTYVLAKVNKAYKVVKRTVTGRGGVTYHDGEKSIAKKNLVAWTELPTMDE